MCLRTRRSRSVWRSKISTRLRTSGNRSMPISRASRVRIRLLINRFSSFCGSWPATDTSSPSMVPGVNSGRSAWCSSPTVIASPSTAARGNRAYFPSVTGTCSFFTPAFVPLPAFLTGGSVKPARWGEVAGTSRVTVSPLRSGAAGAADATMPGLASAGAALASRRRIAADEIRRCMCLPRAKEFVSGCLLLFQLVPICKSKSTHRDEGDQRDSS